MSDVPRRDVPGDESEPYVPSGVRRSTYLPPAGNPESAAGVGPGEFDDDALAAALAAQVAPYTAPVPITPPAGAPPVWSGPTPVGAAEPTSEAAGDSPVAPAAPPPAAPAPAGPASAETAPPEMATSTTLEAIERLESELRRRAEATQTAAGPPAPASGPTSEPVDLPPPPAYDPPTYAPVPPPALIEPPPPASGPPVPPPPAFGPPMTAPVDLPPPVSEETAAEQSEAGESAARESAVRDPVDFAHLPPPVGIDPAPLPPYDPTSEVVIPTPHGPPADVPAPAGEPAPVPPSFDALLGDAFAPHPDDLGPSPESFAPQPFAPPAPASETEPFVDDDVDEIDRAFGPDAIPVDPTGAATILSPPSQPIPTVRLADDEAALVDEEPQSHPALVVETAGPEPTALDLRAGRAARLFWLWFAANSSIVSLALGAVLLGLGMSLRQALVSILIGVALSFLPLGLVTLAGKWSGQPTMIVSRATFGVVGNVLPAVLAVVSRVFWGGALLWVLSAGVARVLVDSGLDVGLGERVWTFVGLGVGFALAFLVSTFGYGLVARVQLVLSILTGILVAGVIAVTFPRIDIAAAQSIDDGPWTLLITGVVLVFSFIGLAWVHSSADVARYQRTDSDGGSTMLWATFGATLPAFVLVAWGALLAASDPLIADGLATNPLYTIAALLPVWYPAPLIAALGLGLLSGVVLTIYSGGFALQALGIRARRSGTTVIAGALVLGAAFALLLLAGDARGLIRDVVTTIAVPIAAWAGIFGAEIMIRRRGFDAGALLRRGGVYPAVRWVNLAGLVVISVVGFGLTSSTLAGLDWQGYLFPLLALPGGDPLLASDIGVLVALVLGILLPLATAIPAIRRQERALVD